jgi:hypothetical protein
MSSISRVARAKQSLSFGVAQRQATIVNVNATGAKADQAWRYEGGKVRRAPSIYLGSSGRRYTDPKASGSVKLPRREQTSNFFITINTNKSPSALEMPRAIRCLEETMNALASDAVLPNYLTFGPRDAHFSGDLASDVIVGVQWRAAIEVGDGVKRLHAHVYLEITHYSQLQINMSRLAEFAKRAWNKCVGAGPLRADKSFYVHVKLMPQNNWSGIMTQYMLKGMAASAIKSDVLVTQPTQLV